MDSDRCFFGGKGPQHSDGSIPGSGQPEPQAPPPIDPAGAAGMVPPPNLYGYLGLGLSTDHLMEGLRGQVDHL